MPTITRALAHRLRVVFTRAIGRSRAGLCHVLFRSDADGLTIGVRGADAAVEYHEPRADQGVTPEVSFAIPLEALKRFEGTSDTPVVLEPQERSVTVRWADVSAPQVESFTRHALPELPPRPDSMAVNTPRLMSALRDAGDCTDAGSARYALSCVQLSGGQGRIAATDAHRLLVQAGFTFPWTDEALVPANAVFASRELHAGHPVSIGRTEGFVMLSSGPWTVHLRIEKDARFPRIDSLIPDPQEAESVFRFGEDDAEFLRTALSKLPGGKEPDAPVTCDLNGQVRIRGKENDQQHPTELLLLKSRVEGKAVVTQTNREFLAHALRLGFRALHLFGPEGTALFQDQHRRFVWRLLGAEGAVPASPEAVRIESPRSDEATTETPVTPMKAARRQLRSKATSAETPEPMPTPTPENGAPSQSGPGLQASQSLQNGHNLHSGPCLQNGHRMQNSHELQNGHAATNGSTEAARSAVETLVALRDTLKVAVGQANDAIRALKRQKREDRLVRSTLASLRQLQTLDV